MPFSNRPSVDATIGQNLPILQERYALRRCMANTALGKLYWAQDLKQTQGNGEQANVLAFTLLPALAQDPVFEQVFGHVLPTYQKSMPGMPQILDDGKTADGTRWMVMLNISGMLLSERLAELDDRGMPLPEALELLDNLKHVFASQTPDGVFGYAEPNAILLTEKAPCLLTAPVAAALRMAYRNPPSEYTRQTLHSGYISPDVLLGDTPTSADDTFSIACLAYHLLQGLPPFGKQTTLEAAVRNFAPGSIRKLRPDTWAALQQGLNLKRAARQPTPTALLRILQRKQQKKLLLPAVALVAASAVAITTYQLLSSWGEPPENAADTRITGLEAIPSNNTPQPDAADTATLVGERGLPPVPDQDSVQAEADKLAAETANQTKPTTTKELSVLQAQAADAIRTGKPAALDYLRQAVALAPDNTKTQQLLTQLITDQHAETEALLSAGKLEEASKLLSTTDRLITEFTLADSLKRQVSLEAEVSQAQRKLALAQEQETPATNATIPPETTAAPSDTDDTNSRQYLERAQQAISYGNLSRGDDRSESAIAYLSPLLAQTPDHPDAMKLLEKIVAAQQEEARTLLSKRDTDKARTALNDSQTLIGKYKLDNQVEEQIALEKRYRETLAMGVFTPGTEPETPATTAPTQPEPAKPEPTATITATPPVAPPAPAQETENPEAAEMATSTEAVPTANPPMEVRVSPDIPVQDAINVTTTELPPVQLENAVPEPITPPSSNVIFEVPATDADHSGTTFTLDVPNLIEVPLDTIKESLPPADR